MPQRHLISCNTANCLNNDLKCELPFEKINIFVNDGLRIRKKSSPKMTFDNIEGSTRDIDRFEIVLMLSVIATYKQRKHTYIAQ